MQKCRKNSLDWFWTVFYNNRDIKRGDFAKVLSHEKSTLLRFSNGNVLAYITIDRSSEKCFKVFALGNFNITKKFFDEFSTFRTAQDVVFYLEDFKNKCTIKTY